MYGEAVYFGHLAVAKVWRVHIVIMQKAELSATWESVGI